MQDSLINYKIDYGSILSGLSVSSIEDAIKILWERLPDVWCEKYNEMTLTETNILQFTDNGFEYLFDFSSELVAKGVVPRNQASENRVVVVFGRSQPSHKKRDKNRMKGFLGPSSKVFGDNYDKGHFIGHAFGGGLEVNLFPQLRGINQGLSARGKVFQSMEKYCSDNAETFCFNRPIYCNLSWRPRMIEFGILTEEMNFWVEIFEN
ncbi:DNA/RNA non-specific endonuclease [Methanosarcina mazei]|uniref:DNA/RNA non-specific endonuclease domain-containing protein n=1 Tax=Methanosarcina mazei TaxID=2209 RepID=A0A0F8E4H8_METMZ|nr:hypothetical protein [Methanosarcina mazei]KKG34636.1 hypothetical protein DU30_00375 [Methanosarcina mazei]KKG64496.1 hypothetical protein DU67_07465 [Methanosarcina mazei]